VDSPLYIAQVMSKRVLETCAFQIPLQRIISSIDGIMHYKEKEHQKIHNDPYLIKFVKCAEFKYVYSNEG